MKFGKHEEFLLISHLGGGGAFFRVFLERVVVVVVGLSETGLDV